MIDILQVQDEVLQTVDEKIKLHDLDDHLEDLNHHGGVKDWILLEYVDDCCNGVRPNCILKDRVFKQVQLNILILFR